VIRLKLLKTIKNNPVNKVINEASHIHILVVVTKVKYTRIC